MYLVLKSVVALLMILVDRMWKKLPADHPAVVQVSEHIVWNKQLTLPLGSSIESSPSE